MKRCIIGLVILTAMIGLEGCNKDKYQHGVPNAIFELATVYMNDDMQSLDKKLIYNDTVYCFKSRHAINSRVYKDYTENVMVAISDGTQVGSYWKNIPMAHYPGDTSYMHTDTTWHFSSDAMKFVKDSSLFLDNMWNKNDGWKN